MKTSILGALTLAYAGLSQAADVEWPSPTAEGIVSTCNKFHKVVDGETCPFIVNVAYNRAFLRSQFHRWNPSLDDLCSNLTVGTYYCVGVEEASFTTSSTASATATDPAKPSPTQDGLIATCTTFYKAVLGDTCIGLVNKNNGAFSLTQFYAWNPAVGQDCLGLWANYYYCVGVPRPGTTLSTSTTATTTSTSSRTSTTTSSTTTQGNGIATPAPTQPGMVKDCDRFYFVKKDQTCREIAYIAGVTEGDLIKWNPTVGNSCLSIWADAYVCTRVIGYVPPKSLTCYTATNTKTWGDNKPAALEAADAWCSSNSLGAGIYGLGQSKSGCYKAPLGQNKFLFQITNNWGVSGAINKTKCLEILNTPINGCARGGEAALVRWGVTASVMAGIC